MYTVCCRFCVKKVIVDPLVLTHRRSPWKFRGFHEKNPDIVHATLQLPFLEPQTSKVSILRRGGEARVELNLNHRRQLCSLHIHLHVRSKEKILQTSSEHNDSADVGYVDGAEVRSGGSG